MTIMNVLATRRRPKRRKQPKRPRARRV